MNTIIENSLPWWQVLTNEEKILIKNWFMSSLLTFYIKSEFAVTNKRFIAHYPKIALWLLPLWFNNITFSVKQISWVQIDVSYKIFRLLIWWIWAFVGFSNMSEASRWFIVMIIWILLFVSAIWTYIKVVTSWWTTYCPILFWEKGKAEILIQKLNASIAENS